MSAYYTLEPHNTLVLRDNRFFGAAAMVSAAWVSPSVMAGSARTVIGKKQGRFDHDALRKIAVAGPFPAAGGELGFVPPADAVAFKNDGGGWRICRLVPQAPGTGQGTDIPGNLQLCFLEPEVQGKPVALKGFWKCERMVQWLLDSKEASQTPYSDEKSLTDWPGPVFETRTHLEVNDKSLAAETGKLFTCTHLAMPGKHGAQYGLSVRVADGTNMDAGFIHPVGGERRLVSWRCEEAAPKGWTCPDAVKKALCGAQKLRLVLATPGIFLEHGWKPGWLDGNNEGTVPQTGVRVRLAAAAVPRWKAVSGWSYEHKGPKPIRRMVPAGAVYFFEVRPGGNAEELAARWLEPIDDEGSDGFGLALWGLWK